MDQDKRPKIFYGYVVVAASLMSSLLIIGGHNTFGVFLKPISSELGWTRAATSAAYSISFIVFGITSIVVGRLTDRFGPKIIIAACGVFWGLGFFLMSYITALWQLYLVYGLIIGIGLSAGDTPVLATIARWFDKKRGMAIGISKAGVGIGIMVIPPLAGLLLSIYGWRTAYVIIGVICFIGIIVAALFLKRDPAEIGQLPDGATKITTSDLDIPIPQFSLHDVLTTRQFRAFSTAWFFVSYCAMTVLTQIAAHASDVGISTTVAATVLGAIGGSSIIGRLVMGFVSDKVGNKLVFVMGLVLMAVSLFLVGYTRELWMFYLFAALYGYAHGTLYTMFTPLLAELFGIRSLGAIVGVFIFVGTLGGSIGPVLAGRIFDLTQSYQIAFLLCLMLSIIAIILMMFVRTTGNLDVHRSRE